MDLWLPGFWGGHLMLGLYSVSGMVNSSKYRVSAFDEAARENYGEDRHESAPLTPSGSSHLEEILGRIHEIMAEPVPPSPQRADHRDNGPYEVQQMGAGETDEAYQMAADAAGQAFLAATEQISARADGHDDDHSHEQGFAAGPPADMVAPYSEVLKEVRDYFKDRHSLDPSDRLIDDLNNTPTYRQQRPDERPHEGALDTKDLFSPIEFRSTLQPLTQSMERALNADRGPNESHVSPVSDAGETKAIPNEARDAPSLMARQPLDHAAALRGDSTINDPHLQTTPRQKRDEQAFQHDAFASQMPSFAPPHQEGMSGEELGEFRRELAERFSQLETVIGHHYGDRNKLARDAARVAVETTLQKLDETPIGKRLEALEQVFNSFQQRQDLTNEKTGDVLERLSRLLLDEEQGKLEAESAPQLERSVRKVEVQGAGQDQRIDQQGEGGVSSATQKPEMEQADKAIPPQLRVKSRISGAPPLPEQALPENRAMEQRDGEVNFDAGAYEETVEVTSIAAGSEDEPVSELEEIQSGAMGLGPRSMTAYPPSTEGRPDLRNQGHNEDFLTKSAALRARFNEREIMSRDDDLDGLQRRGARPAIIIVVVALLLAAAGLAVRNDLEDVRYFFKGMKSDLSEFLAEDSLQAGRDDLEKSEKTARIKDQTPLFLKRDGEEITITGNIERIEGKSANRLSDQHNGLSPDIEPESLLPSGTQIVSLPPALIGPYSLRHAAANGEASAQFEVARRFAKGQGVKKDDVQAARWYMYAAAQGFPPAQYRLATLYERGLGVRRSYGQAAIWYRRAAQLGNVKAMHNLAVLSTSREKARPDYATAIKWFKEAALRDLADSQFNLAILYQSGVGVPKNNVEAYKWFSLAARRGDKDAAARRDVLAGKMAKNELLQAHNILRRWQPLTLDAKANAIGLKGRHVTSTMSHAEETSQRSKVLTVQILLRRLGYDVAEADGFLNEETIVAIRKFEKDKGMPITGQVSKGLIKVLNQFAL